jgi:hypothetical protein
MRSLGCVLAALALLTLIAQTVEAGHRHDEASVLPEEFHGGAQSPIHAPVVPTVESECPLCKSTIGGRDLCAPPDGAHPEPRVVEPRRLTPLAGRTGSAPVVSGPPARGPPSSVRS